MSKERSDFVEDDSEWISVDIHELAHEGNVFEHLQYNLHGRTDYQSILHAAETIFTASERDRQWAHYPPLGGSYDTPQGKDLIALCGIIGKEVTEGKVFPHTEQIHPRMIVGHACAFIDSLITEQTVDGWHAASVKTYIFLTNKGERNGNYIAFSLINERLGGHEEHKFLQGFAEPRLYAKTPVVRLVVPQTIEQ